MAAPARAAVAALAADPGAHIVLLRGKVPCWPDRGKYSWPKWRPAAAVIEAHPHQFGIVPWSLSTCGLDVDQGDPLQLSMLVQPLANLRTKRGHHLYCSDSKPRRNGKFEAAGCQGDVRSAGGYLAFQFLDAVKAAKHRAILTTCYAAGLRISEAVRLTVSAIDSKRMVLRIAKGKGQKDRYVMLSPKLLAVLRAWRQVERPRTGSFPASAPRRRSRAARSSLPAGSPPGVRASASPLRHIRFGTLRHSATPSQEGRFPRGFVPGWDLSGAVGGHRGRLRFPLARRASRDPGG